MKLTPDKHLHSKEHLLADDLSRQMLEPKHFAAYLGIAKLYYESDLRALAKYVLQKVDLPPEARGKYFFAAVSGLPKKPGAKLKKGKAASAKAAASRRKKNPKNRNKNKNGKSKTNNSRTGKSTS